MAKSLLVGGLVCAGMAAASAASPAELVVEVTHVRSAGGSVRIAVYDNAVDWLNEDVTGRIAPAVQGVTTVRFEGLPPGTYAIAAYHDENGNGRFDKLFATFPAEGFAFSNDVRPFLSAPTFASAAFRVGDAEATTARFRMVYP